MTCLEIHMNDASASADAMGDDFATTQKSAVRVVSKKVVAATVIGNALEFYDFVTYAFFAVYIGKSFFPASTALGSLLLSVAVFGVGFVTRPLGGIFIGAYADRVGRRPALLMTIGLITLGTLGLALTPNFESIGSSAFLIESAPETQRGLYGSWQLASQGLATLVAGGIGLLMSSLLSPEELLACLFWPSWAARSLLMLATI
jgi:MFS family permease